MAKDARQLRDEATAANAAGKHKRALELYAELERIESADAQWPKRMAETYRKLGKSAEAVASYERAADRYANNGFLVQAIAVCKLILQIDPNHLSTQRRLAEMNTAHVTGKTQIGALSDSHPSLHATPSVARIRAESIGIVEQSDEPELTLVGAGTAGAGTPAPRVPRITLTPPLVAPAVPSVARTRSKPITLTQGMGLETVALRDVVPGARELRDDGSSPGIMLIPLGDSHANLPRPSDDDLVISVSNGEDDIELDAADIEEAEELDLVDIEEIPLPAPKRVSEAARRALAATPLFAAMEADAIETLISRLQLVTLERGEVLFTEGDAGEALYIVAEGEVSVATEGPPRVEMQRLSAGAFFGEVALITDTPRTATVSAVTDCDLLRIGRDTLAFLLQTHPDVLRALLRFVRERLVDRWTRTSPIFRPFDAAERSSLVARFRFLEIDDGSRIVTANTKPDGLYIVLAGRAEVTHDGAVLAALGPGDLLGERALLTGAKIDNDVRAVGKCLALCLPTADFREIIMTHPHVLEYIGDQADQHNKLEMT
ncbi:MAG: cyclic nucleotide-binding domain-containing protein [Kofleriaceae bacterium]|nr:cyclic nucleotide-binding domain-containing protein [Kofleriaceae bacterium]